MKILNRKMIFFKVRRLSLLLLILIPLNVKAQTCDSITANKMRDVGVNFTHDNSVTLLMNGQEKFDDMFAAIRQAKRSIHLEYFNFRNDSIANLLFDILAEKHNEGVEVRALFDGFGNDSNNQPLHKSQLKKLRSRGIEIYEFDPIHFPWINHVWHRDHRKIVVIDGTIAYTGGMNVADYYIKGTKRVGCWRDMHCRIEGSAVNNLQTIFLRIWNKVTRQNIHGAEYYQCYDSLAFHGLKPDTTVNAHHKMVGIVNREPHTSNAIIRQLYLTSINNAKSHIQIINPYLTLNHELKKALRNAVKRGVKVEIMVSSHSDIPLTPDCVFYNVHTLMKHGADIYLYNEGFHHSKIMMIDDQFCTVGSANLNSRSLSFDYEENALIMDKGTTKELSDMFNRDKENSTYLTPKTWKIFRNPWQRFVGWFAHLLTPIL
jgi:cardiolipin synthase A/B